VAASDETGVAGRGYLTTHRSAIGASGIACSVLAVGVLGFYVDSTKSAALYAYPHWLWLLLPLLAAWLARVWLLTWRGRMHDDPVVFALTDPPSFVVLAGFVATIALAT